MGMPREDRRQPCVRFRPGLERRTLGADRLRAKVMAGQACRTTFFTAADRRYELFVLPYAASVLAHNVDARLEICLHDADGFERRNADALRLLAEAYGDGRLLLRNTESVGVSPNSARFLETPKVLTEYTYIGDIDILVLEAVSDIHIERMDELGLPYSNQVRTGRRALSGLHFTRSDAYYPVVPPDGNPHGDEALLYALVTARGWATPPEGVKRPGVHGYHMSPNRSPLSPQADSRSTVAWGLGRSEAHLSAYRALKQSDLWCELFPILDVRYRLLLGLLDLGLAWRYPGEVLRPSREVEGLLRNVDLVRGIVAMPDRRAGQADQEVAGDAASD